VFSGFDTFLRVLVGYVIVVGLLFMGFLMLARARNITKDRRGIVWRLLVIVLAALYVVGGVVFVLNPTRSIPFVLVASLGSILLGFSLTGWQRITLDEPDLALLFVLPSVIGIFLFYYYQIAQTIIYSFHNLDHTTRWTAQNFVGLRNFLAVFGSSSFLAALGFTLYFTAVAVFLEFWIGLGMALATFWVGRHARGFLRSMVVIPWAIPPIISAAVWKWFFNADVGFSSLFVQAGLVKQMPIFLIEPVWAMHAVILADVWKMSSMLAILLMGGLAIIPQDVYDAAKVDGARAFYRFRRITLPLLLPTILVALLFRAMDALRTFDLIYGLTKGGPGNTTETLSSLAYKFYFSRASFGMGSAYGVVVFVLILVLGVFYVNRIRKNLRFKET